MIAGGGIFTIDTDARLVVARVRVTVTFTAPTVGEIVIAGLTFTARPAIRVRNAHTLSRAHLAEVIHTSGLVTVAG